MVGTNTSETSSLNELFHQVWAGTHVCHIPNINDITSMRYPIMVDIIEMLRYFVVLEGILAVTP